MVPNTPLSPVRMVPLTMLRPDEVAVVAQGKDERDALAAKLVEAGYGHYSDFERASVI